MPLRHVALVILTMCLWGVNFVPIRVALDSFSAFELGALRFVFSAIPAVFFIPRPRIPRRLLFAFGFVLFDCQFGFLFSGIKFGGVSPGLASLLMQFQVFFTLAMAAAFLNERPGPWKVFGASVAFLGVLWVFVHADGTLTPLGVALALVGALSWAGGNLISKKVGSVNPLALVAWGNLVASPLMVLAALATEGPAQVATSLAQASLASWAGLSFIVGVSTLLAYSIWGFLLSRYPASTVAPFSLLVPIFGFLASALLLGEPLQPWKLQAGGLVLLGLAFNIIGARRQASSRARS